MMGVLVPWSIWIEMGPLVKAPGKEVTEYGNLGGKRCLQINGRCALHLKIGTKQNHMRFQQRRSGRPASVSVIHLLLNPLNTFYPQYSSNIHDDVLESRQTLSSRLDRKRTKQRSPDPFSDSEIRGLWNLCPCIPVPSDSCAVQLCAELAMNTKPILRRR